MTSEHDTKVGYNATHRQIRAVKALPTILQSALKVVADATGWVFFVGAAGPNPSDGGHIYMEK